MEQDLWVWVSIDWLYPLPWEWDNIFVIAVTLLLQLLLSHRPSLRSISQLTYLLLFAFQSFPRDADELLFLYAIIYHHVIGQLRLRGPSGNFHLNERRRESLRILYHWKARARTYYANYIFPALPPTILFHTGRSIPYQHAHIKSITQSDQSIRSIRSCYIILYYTTLHHPWNKDKENPVEIKKRKYCKRKKRKYCKRKHSKAQQSRA